MRRIPLSAFSGLCPLALGVSVLCSSASGADPGASSPPATDNPIIRVQAPPVPQPEQPAPTSTIPPTAAPAPVTPVTAPSAPPPASLGSTGGVATPEAAAAGRPNAPIVPQTSANVVGGGESQTRNATDVGSLLGKSLDDPGVVIQRRNPIVSDPRIRGQHMGQINVTADGGYWVPARLDLDTIVSKIDASDINNVIVIKGPYSVHNGPGFSFIDIATNNTPRYENGFEAHSRTILSYQTNGTGWNGREGVYGGGEDWGFRAGYGIRSAIDYHAGNGYDVPSSYNSQDVNFAFGLSFGKNSAVEFKAVHLNQSNLEFPGLYFDIAHLQSDAYTMRYFLNNQDYFDRFNLDLWYNHTGAEGNTQQGAKQVFLNTFLSNQPGVLASVVPPFPPPGPSAPGTVTPLSAMAGGVRDFSLTNFAERAEGYRTSLSWGDPGCVQVTVGNDLNYVGSYLNEFIRVAPPVASTGFAGPLVVPPAGATSAPLGFENFGMPQSHFVDPGLFLETVVPIGKRLTLKGGTRGDLYTSQANTQIITGNFVLFPPGPGGAPGTVLNPQIYSSKAVGTTILDPNLSRHMGLWSAYLTAEYNVDEHLTALGGFGYAQRPPTLTELYAAGPFVNLLQQGLTRIVGDPHLLPEKMKQMDLGLRGNYGWFRGGVSGFYSWVDDYITYNQMSTATPYNLLAPTLTSTTNFGSSNTVVFTNTPRATLAGGELYAQADATTWLTPFGTLMYVQGRDLTHNVDRNNPALVSSRTGAAQESLPGIAPLQSVVGIRIHDACQNPVWNVEVSALMVAGQHLVASSLDELPTPGYTIWNLRGFWKTSDHVLLTGGVENFGDKFYRSHLDPRSGSPTDVLFQPGTNFYGGVQVTY